MFQGPRQEQYRRLKLQGILDAPINICIVCDRRQQSEPVLGKTHQPETDVYSTVCAVQNLWLSARAENLGVGWVSIIEPTRLKKALHLPMGVVPVAYLCLGHVTHFENQPELQIKQWARREPVESFIYDDELKENSSNVLD